MKRSRNPLLFGIAGALLAGMAFVAGPPSANAQAPTAPDKKEDVGPKRRTDLAEKMKPGSDSEKSGSRAVKVTPSNPKRGTQAKPRGTNQIPEPTVVLKPGEMPGIKFDMTTYDFGRIRAGADVVHDFWFTNTGNGPLELLRVKPG